MPRNLPTFRQYLAEDDSEDIVSGLRKLVTDIRSNWRTPYSSVRGEQVKHWRKITPAQQENLKRLFTDVVQAMLVDVNRPIATSVFRPTTKQEAIVIPMTFYALAKGAAEVGTGIIDSALARGHLTPKEAEQFEQQYAGNGNKPVDPPIGRNVNQFVTDHRAKLSTIISSYDENGFSFDVPKIITAMVNAIEHKETPEAKRKEAVMDIHYLFLKMSSLLNAAGQQLESKFAGNSLPDEAPQPGQPPGGKGPAPVTKP